jgi:hypothetical protein
MGELRADSVNIGNNPFMSSIFNGKFEMCALFFKEVGVGNTVSFNAKNRDSGIVRIS